MKKKAFFIFFGYIYLMLFSTSSMPSSFTECYLDVDVLKAKIASRPNSIESLHIRVYAVDEASSFECQYHAGHEIVINDVELINLLASEIGTGKRLEIYNLNYEALGEDGPVAGSTWTVLKIK